jgi:TRAP-type mannitol/chloroaromatic compound transport system permease large subunit
VSGNEILAVLMLVSFMVLVFTGFPIAWILGGIAVLFTALAIVLEVDFNIPTGMDWSYASISVERIWNVMENWVMVALPMFIFMGLLLDRSGIARELMTGFLAPAGRRARRTRDHRDGDRPAAGRNHRHHRRIRGVCSRCSACR